MSGRASRRPVACLDVASVFFATYLLLFHGRTATAAKDSVNNKFEEFDNFQQFLILQWIIAGIQLVLFQNRPALKLHASMEWCGSLLVTWGVLGLYECLSYE